MAFDHADDGQLQTVFGPQDLQTEDRAIQTAQSLATTYRGVIAWSREINIDLGEYGPPTTLFVSGDVPDMEIGVGRKKTHAPANRSGRNILLALGRWLGRQRVEEFVLDASERQLR